MAVHNNNADSVLTSISTTVIVRLCNSCCNFTYFSLLPPSSQIRYYSYKRHQTLVGTIHEPTVKVDRRKPAVVVNGVTYPIPKLASMVQAAEHLAEYEQKLRQPPLKATIGGWSEFYMGENEVMVRTCGDF